MAEEKTDEEQIEALKAWWDENGTKTLAALVLVIGGYFGWETWSNNIQLQSQQASDLWQDTIDMVEGKSARDVAVDQMILVGSNIDKLKQDYGDTAYGHFAAALRAKLSVEMGDLDTAADALQWSLDNSSDEATQIITRLRLARVEAARGNFDLALKMVQEVDSGSHRAAYAEATGDFYVQLGDGEAAYSAYESAIAASQSADTTTRNVLALKISQVAPAIPSADVDQIDPAAEVDSVTLETSE